MVCEENRDAADKPGAQRGFDLRCVPPDMLVIGATLSGFRIATRTFGAPKFNTVYQSYAAEPIAPALVQFHQVGVGLFVFVPIGLTLAGLA